jgi:hypothetical protein
VPLLRLESAIEISFLGLMMRLGAVYILFEGAVDGKLANDERLKRRRRKGKLVVKAPTQKIE